MNISFSLVAASGLALGVLIYHSYKLRGLQKTLLFYLTALFYFSVYQGLLQLKLVNAEPTLGLDSNSVGYSVILAIICLHIVAAYLSMSIAEQIVKRTRAGGDSFFLTLACSLCISASWAYIFQVCGINLGWWDIPDKPTSSGFEQSIMYAVLPAIITWSVVINRFIAPFLLFQSTSLKLKRGKSIAMIVMQFLLLFSQTAFLQHFHISFLPELFILSMGLFHSGISINALKRPDKTSSDFTTEYAVIGASIVLIGVSLLISLTGNVHIQVIVSALSSILFVLLYSRLVSTLSLSLMVISTYIVGYLLEKPTVSYALFPVAIMLGILLIRSIGRSICSACGKSPLMISQILLRYASAITLAVWLYLVIRATLLT